MLKVFLFKTSNDKLDSNYSNIPDEELMQAICKGDEIAFNEIYARYSQRILYFLFKMLGQDEATAQDLLQEIFAMIAEKPEKFSSVKNFKSWIFTVASNRCKNYFRDHKNRFESLPEEDVSTNQLMETPEFELEEQNIKEKLNEALQLIHPTYKEAFILRYFEGLRNDEIAEVLNCPVGTVKSRLHQALKALNKVLKNYYEELKN